MDGTYALPSLAQVPEVRREFLPVYVGERSVDFLLFHHHEREHAARHLAAHAGSIITNARQICIYVNDDGIGGEEKVHDSMLRFTLGPHSVDWAFPSAGSHRIDNVHVVFDSLRGSRPGDWDDALESAVRNKRRQRHNARVARRIAAAINRMLISHGSGSPLHITRRELMRLLGLLDDIHGIKLHGFGDGLGSRHIDRSAAAQFWTMVERN